MTRATRERTIRRIAALEAMADRDPDGHEGRLARQRADELRLRLKEDDGVQAAPAVITVEWLRSMAADIKENGVKPQPYDGRDSDQR